MRSFRLLLCCAFVVLAASAGAQTWPSRPVKLIVPTGPGAATDVMARLLADGASRTLGQPMVVENMPGASGILAHQSVARAGRRLHAAVHQYLGHGDQPRFVQATPLRPYARFHGGGTGAQPRSADAVGERRPARCDGELIAYAKSELGKLSIAFDNTAGAAAFGAKLFNRRADLGLVEVPYRPPRRWRKTSQAASTK